MTIKAGLDIGSPSLKKKSSAHYWVSTDDASVSHCPYGLPGVLILPRQDLTPPLGSFLQIPLPTAADLHAAAVDSHDNATNLDNGDSEGSEEDSPTEGLHPLVFPAEQGTPMKKMDKKISLWKNWALKLIPELLDPYMNLLMESENLKNIDRRLPQCSCNGVGHKMKVIAVFFESKLFLLPYNLFSMANLL